MNKVFKKFFLLTATFVAFYLVNFLFFGASKHSESATSLNLNDFDVGNLINVGYLYTKDKFDYTVQHDVDLLALNPKLSYEFPSDCVFHVMNSFFHPEKNYRNHVSCSNFQLKVN
jgi:hypothetical protein